MTRVQFSAGESPEYPWGPPVLYREYQEFLEQPEDKDVRSLPSGAEVKNVWNFTSSFVVCLHSMVLKKRSNYTFLCDC
jgi:hypothetical protein